MEQMEHNESTEGATLYEAVVEKPQMKVYSKKEKQMVPLAAGLAILFDRLIFANLFAAHLRMTFAVFWLIYIGAFYLLYFDRLKKDKVLGVAHGCVALLCIWQLIFSHGNDEYAALTALVIPAVLMATGQWFRHQFTPYRLRGIFLAWFLGWTTDMLMGIPYAMGVLSQLVSLKNKGTLTKVVVGLFISFVMMLGLLPLLMSADQVFNYYVMQFFGNLSLQVSVIHLILIGLTYLCCYSFLFRLSKTEQKNKSFEMTMHWDGLIVTIVLTSVVILYTLFCAVQFTYLFARAGLPTNLTFAEYARAGFAQTVVVCGLNLMIFGLTLKYSQILVALRGLLTLLMVLTGVMLVSGAVRLNLYIEAFGFTWLRLLSAWFITYVGLVSILSSVSLYVKKKWPVLFISAMLLLVMYVILGYLNPDAFIASYNTRMFS